MLHSAFDPPSVFSAMARLRCLQLCPSVHVHVYLVLYVRLLFCRRRFVHWMPKKHTLQIISCIVTVPLPAVFRPFPPEKPTDDAVWPRPCAGNPKHSSCPPDQCSRFIGTRVQFSWGGRPPPPFDLPPHGDDVPDPMLLSTSRWGDGAWLPGLDASRARLIPAPGTGIELRNGGDSTFLFCFFKHRHVYYKGPRGSLAV
ncbi:hypothetical protein LX36DRAFT_129551 [Colletotrichum falcatum]|nr:hypothetical protein LX36DRAFT_129551 [Colletotrichum falcatum]